MNILCMVINIIFSKFNKVPIYYLIIMIILMIVLGLLSYQDIYSLLPIVAVILYSIALYKWQNKIIRLIELISCSLFIVYNIKVGAYIGFNNNWVYRLFNYNNI